MRVYHFLDRKYGLENINQRRLKIATLDDLNGPFEMFALSLRDPELRQAFQAMKSQMSQLAGMLCFSRSWRNPVQWSHYAERHHGMCLGFDVPDDLLTRVAYSRKRLPIDRALLEGPDAKALMRTVASTKFSHWRYENEVRLFVALEDRDAETGLWFRDFDADLALKEVIVGQVCDVTRSQLGNALGDLNATVTKRKARLPFQRFAVVNQMRADLWK
ncbi:hypothetical protein MB02_14740 [Croceicoccus estronivorus]|uniref:DUF2971 domain-containing protein n=1 Tax=Croceicoccus estronivorus TaxID=1172626 RepID=UPI000832095B|nr:DUF2971 domain-containing protein [Croceicoccus estronivorus]OCC22819.1 hypothetical protein MB02_14740 [Croceicoccus estronivorus]